MMYCFSVLYCIGAQLEHCIIFPSKYFTGFIILQSGKGQDWLQDKNKATEPYFPCSVNIFFYPKLQNYAFIFVGGYKDKLGRFALVAKDALQKVNQKLRFARLFWQGLPKLWLPK